MKKQSYIHLVVGILIIMSGIFTLRGFPISFFHGGVLRFGPLTLGGESPIGPGSTTFAPELSIPPSRFYIGVAEKDVWCVFEECSPLGGKIAARGGWLQGEDTDHWTTAEDFGLKGRTDVASVVVVGNKEGRLVGIYPDKTMDNLASILAIHRSLWEQ